MLLGKSDLGGSAALGNSGGSGAGAEALQFVPFLRPEVRPQCAEAAVETHGALSCVALPGANKKHSSAGIAGLPKGSLPGIAGACRI